ncbi:MAG: chitobiase/beta-hexosaminidase C-terminal domain-containing protein [Methanobacteriaceae archaeon]|nr:chitobiase/beta-hexosaminidase C-terminal domain-containing protein [Methanobacteriaceae archaeon]
MKFKFLMIMAVLLLFCTTISSASAAHVYNITDNSYNKYFNKSGYINNTSIQAGDTLDLSGTIKNKNMYIDRPLNITSSSKTAQIINGTITILSSGSGTSVSYINIKNDDHKGIVIFESENNTIKNNTIKVNENQESYAIYLHDSRNNKIVGNSLTTTGNYVTIGILLYASDNNEITSNKVNTTGTGVPLPYLSSVTLSQEIGAIKEIFPTYSILLLFSSDNNITGNDVVLKSGLSTPTAPTINCKNSMVGVDIYYDSNNNTVTNNHIKVIGNNPYSYGLGVLGSYWGTSNSSAENNVFSHNTIDVTGSHFASGFIAGLNSLNTILSENTINVSADSYSYGVTLEASRGSTIFKNIITTKANVNYAVELFISHNNHINENKIYPSGNYSLGIGTYNSGSNSIIHNIIITNGDNSAPQISNGEAIPAGNEGILLYLNSNQNTVEDNIISSSALYAVNTTESSHNTIIKNYLISAGGSKLGDAAVARGTNDTVNGNYGGSPIADFTLKTTKSAPLTVQFTSRSIGIITRWTWDFNGDGKVDSTLQNPTYTYTKPGKYTVKLTLTGPGGTDFKTVNITVQPDTTVPVAKVNIKGGLYNTTKTVTLTATDNQDPNPKIYYTINGTTPTTKSKKYTTPINITKTTTLKYLAVDQAGNKSPIYTQKYTIDKVAPKVSVNVKGGSYKTSQKVTLKISEDGNIYYTINGTTPTTKSKKYTTPINITKTTTLKYLAVDQAGNKSPIYTQKYTIDKVAPKVVKTNPTPNATKVPLTTPLTIKFSENIVKGINFNHIRLKNPIIPKMVDITLSIQETTLIIKIRSSLYKNTYQLYVTTTAVKDLAGNIITKFPSIFIFILGFVILSKLLSRC